MELNEKRREHLGSRERTALEKIIDLLCTHKFSEPFLKPVEYVRLGLTDYPLVIQQPMDLETARCKLRDYKYKFGEECLRDLLLIWENCRKYNESSNKLLVKWANEMEAYQHRITKNYLPAALPKPLHRRTAKRQSAVKIEVNNAVCMPEVKIQACKIEEKLENKETHPLIGVQAEVKIEPTFNINDHLDKLAIQAQNSLQKIGEVAQQITPKESQMEEANRWEAVSYQIRENFLSLLDECNDCEVTLIFMMIKRRCFHCIEFDSQGNSTINLAKIDDYTLALAKTQIVIWRNKKSMDNPQ